MDDPSHPWRTIDAAPAPSASRASGILATGLPRLAALGGAAALALLAVVLATGQGNGSVLLEAGAPTAGSSIAGDGLLVVEVAGAVARPGLYRLHPGTRVGEAIAAAGGYDPRVDAIAVAANLNLAERVADGDRIVVPSRHDATAPSHGGGTAPGGVVDLNAATAAELEALPGIGEVTAARIIAARDEAPFERVDDLRTRGLVGEKTFERLRDLVTVR